jgi:hypothetical protein
MIGLLDGKNSIRDVISKFAQFYQEPEELVRNDMEIFFKNILERGWVHVK